MAKNDVWFETPPMRDDYQLAPVSADYLKSAVKPKQFLHIDQAECILCEGCVDICPWKCIHYLSVDAIAEATRRHIALQFVSEALALAREAIAERQRG